MRVARGLAAELVGSAMLLAIIIGSGEMGERLAQGNAAIVLLANSMATGCGLFVLIVALAPYSAAEFNPLVTFLSVLDGRARPGIAACTVAAQVGGAVVGVWIAHAMFELPIFAMSSKVRSGWGQLIAEGVATFGLILTIAGSRSHGIVTRGAAVGAYIASAYWFTSSTSFANPAVTLARALSPTFAGVAPANVPAFIVAQGVGAALGYGFTKMLGNVSAPDALP